MICYFSCFSCIVCIVFIHTNNKDNYTKKVFVVVYNTYKQEQRYRLYNTKQRHKNFLFLFFLFFFWFFSFVSFFSFSFALAAPREYYTPIQARIRPKKIPTFSTIFLRIFYGFSTPGLQNCICDIVREPLFVNIVREPLFRSDKKDRNECSLQNTKYFYDLFIFFGDMCVEKYTQECRER